MKKLVILLGILFGIASASYAQTPTIQGDFLEWDQGATSLAEATAFQAQLFVDSTTTSTAVAKTCSGTSSPFVCRTQLAGLVAGAHQLRLSVRQTLTDGRVVESALSNPLSIIWIAPPTPGSLRIAPFTPSLVTQPPGE